MRNSALGVIPDVDPLGRNRIALTKRDKSRCGPVTGTEPESLRAWRGRFCSVTESATAEARVRVQRSGSVVKKTECRSGKDSSVKGPSQRPSAKAPE